MTTQIFPSLIEAIQSLYKQKVFIVQKQVLSGGDINQAYCLSLSNGDRLFVKMNDANRMDMFKKEAAAQMNSCFFIGFMLSFQISDLLAVDTVARISGPSVNAGQAVGAGVIVSRMAHVASAGGIVDQAFHFRPAMTAAGDTVAVLGTAGVCKECPQAAETFTASAGFA